VVVLLILMRQTSTLQKIMFSDMWLICPGPTINLQFLTRTIFILGGATGGAPWVSIANGYEPAVSFFEGIRTTGPPVLVACQRWPPHNNGHQEPFYIPAHS
jgi:hypothetical protein